MDIDNAKREFIKYIDTFDTFNFEIKRKLSHSLRVMDLCTYIATSLNLSKSEIQIASLIGLLHDIAKFKPFKNYLSDLSTKNSVHGDIGVEILKRNNYIRNFIEDDSYDNIIFTAIRNHNRFEIETDLPKKELLFAKIIRDADKIDKIYQASFLFWTTKPDAIKNIENSTFKDNYFLSFKEENSIKITDRNSWDSDFAFFLCIIAFVFDINFGVTFKLLQEKDYINKIIDRFDFKNHETKKRIEEVRTIINNYISSKAC